MNLADEIEQRRLKFADVGDGHYEMPSEIEHEQIICGLRQQFAAKQSRRGSFIESCANTAFGLIISVAASFLIFPLLGVASTPAQNIGAVILFTVVSILRNYFVRRLFNAQRQ